MRQEARWGWAGAVLALTVGTASADGIVGGYHGLTWRFTASAFSRSIGSTHVDGGSLASEADVPGISTAVRGPRADVGPADAVAVRHYDDGFVGIDGATIPYGSTHNWSVDHPRTQIAGSTVTLSALDGTQSDPVSRRPTGDAGGGEATGRSQEWGQSLQVEVGYSANTTTVWSLLGALSTLHSARGVSQTRFSETESWRDVDRVIVDQFSLTPMGLQNVPASRSVQERNARSHRIVTESLVSEQVDMDLQTLSLGVSRTQRWKWLEFAAAAGPTMNVVRGDVTRDEAVSVSRDGGTPVVTQRWHAEQTDDKVLLGGFVQGSAGMRVGRLMHLALQGRYDVTQDYRGQLGPSDYHTSLNGFSVGASCGWDL